MFHELKITPAFFRMARYGKSFEIRKNDRNFKEDDKVMLREWDEFKRCYTGEDMLIRINAVYLDTEVPGLQKGYCIFTFDKLHISDD